MIRPLHNNHYQRIESYLDNDHFYNSYLIHALQTYGVESKHAGFWGALENSKIVGVLYIECIEDVRLGSLCGDTNKILRQLGRCALKNGVNVLTGKKANLTPVVEGQRDRFTIEGQYKFYQLSPDQLKGRYDYSVHKASENDISILVDLYKTSELGNNKDKNRRVIESEIRRTMKYESGYFFIRQNERATCAARIVAETDKAGIIDGATTRHENRGQGMYPSVRTACFEYLFKKNKIGLGYIQDSDKVMHKIIEKNGGVFLEKWLIVNVNKRMHLQKIKNKLQRIIHRSIIS